MRRRAWDFVGSPLYMKIAWAMWIIGFTAVLVGTVLQLVLY